MLTKGQGLCKVVILTCHPAASTAASPIPLMGKVRLPEVKEFASVHLVRGGSGIPESILQSIYHPHLQALAASLHTLEEERGPSSHLQASFTSPLPQHSQGSPTWGPVQTPPAPPLETGGARAQQAVGWKNRHIEDREPMQGWGSAGGGPALPGTCKAGRQTP